MHTRVLVAAMVLVVGLVSVTPASGSHTVSAASPRTSPPVVHLQKVTKFVTSASTGSGHWMAGCRYSASDFLGSDWTIYSGTIWQEYKAIRNFRITYFPEQTTSATAYYGWTLNEYGSSSSHWRMGSRSAAARASFQFTQYIAGQPFQSRSIWVQVTVRASGSWSCTSS